MSEAKRPESEHEAERSAHGPLGSKESTPESPPDRDASASDVEKAPTLEEGERSSKTDSWRFKNPPEGATRREEAEGDDNDLSLIGTLVGERYQVNRILGRGGMGAVFEAEHVHMKKLVALKVLHGYMSQNPEVVQRFEREAVAAGRLQHPGIVAATDFGRLGTDSFYLALELVEGESLAELLAREGALAPERALHIAIQINSALIAAHAEGIVHRDLKPDNVMLVRTDDPEDFVKVLDFGIAKMNAEDGKEGITRAGLVFGTPEYMSPEQAKGHEADDRSDLYGVGMLLYEMLAGRSPFREDDLTAMLTAQIVDPPPPLPDTVPESLVMLVMALLEKDPENRPASAIELAEEFAHLVERLHFTMPAPRTSAGTRLDVTAPRMKSRPQIETRTARREGALARFSKRPVPIGSKKIPLWVPLLALVVGTGIGAAAMLQNEEVVLPKPAVVTEAPPDSEQFLLTEAKSGKREAIAELRKLASAKQEELFQSGLVAEEGEDWVVKEGSGTKTEAGEDPVVKQANRYMVLGRGYTEILLHEAAIEMYTNAVRLDPHLSGEGQLLIDVRMAIGARDAIEAGLDFAHRHLGAHGADLIYDVYLDHIGEAGMTPVVARAMKLVNSGELHEQATPELKVALALQNARLCGDYRDLLPEAALHADDRSLAKLRALTVRRGCGTYGNKDCFLCLRKDEGPLNAAVARAETHPSPTFLTPPELAEERGTPSPAPGPPPLEGE